MLKRLSGIMRNTTAYRLWQAPFAHAKLAPILLHNDMADGSRVLDVGCGPGTNCTTFQNCEYMGIDINPEYIEYAKKKFDRRFVVQDVCKFDTADYGRFDFVLLNSLLHHLDDTETHRILSQLANVMAREGSVHIIELVLPSERGIPRWLAMNDRGDFARSLESWQKIFEQHFQSNCFEPFPIKLLGKTLWELVYFKGTVKT